MRTQAFWKVITMDQENFIERLVDLLEAHQIHYCVIGGQAVNAYVEPLVSLDLDLVVAAEQLRHLEALLAKNFKVKRFPHSLNVSLTGSDLRVQIQTDPRYAAFPEGASPRSILGMTLPVASIEDVLAGKVWAAQDPTRRSSKRQKDLADIARLLEAYPMLRDRVPTNILEKLI